jgi:hypothetical protein
VQVETLVIPPGPRFGDGPMPRELNRVNWGAAFMSGWWALAHGLLWWLLAILLVRLLGIGAISLWDRSPLRDIVWVRYALGVIAATFDAGLVVLLATRANQLYWDKQAARVARQSDQSVPQPAVRVSEYVKTQRTWTIVGGILLLALDGFSLSRSLASSSTFTWYLAIELVPSILMFGGLLFYDRTLAGRSQSEQALPADSGSR